MLIVEGGGGAGRGGGGEFFRGGRKCGEGGGVGLEGFGGGTHPDDRDGEVVALLDLGEHIESAHGATEDGMKVIQAVYRGEREKEFGAVGVGAVVGHGEDAGGIMAEAGCELIGKRQRVAGIGVRLGAGGFCGVAALNDEAGDDTIPT